MVKVSAAVVAAAAAATATYFTAVHFRPRSVRKWTLYVQCTRIHMYTL